MLGISSRRPSLVTVRQRMVPQGPLPRIKLTWGSMKATAWRQLIQPVGPISPLSLPTTTKIMVSMIVRVSFGMPFRMVDRKSAIGIDDLA